MESLAAGSPSANPEGALTLRKTPIGTIASCLTERLSPEPLWTTQCRARSFQLFNDLSGQNEQFASGSIIRYDNIAIQYLENVAEVVSGIRVADQEVNR